MQNHSNLVSNFAEENLENCFTSTLLLWKIGKTVLSTLGFFLFIFHLLLGSVSSLTP
jgi:hypothetical protein